jgi:hypothetical protein
METVAIARETVLAVASSSNGVMMRGGGTSIGQKKPVAGYIYLRFSQKGLNGVNSQQGGKKDDLAWATKAQNPETRHCPKGRNAQRNGLWKYDTPA